LIIGIPMAALAALVIAPSISSVHCTVVNSTSYSNVTCTGLAPLAGSLPLVWALYIVVAVVYFAGLWTAQGQTLGQKLCGLHVVDVATGGRISGGRAVGRYVGFVVSSWVLAIGLIWAAFDPRKQGWHDKMASTYVVRRI